MIPIVLLMLGYPPSLGPAVYAVQRGWLPSTPTLHAYEPVDRLLRWNPAAYLLWNRYAVWWTTLGTKHRHAACD